MSAGEYVTIELHRAVVKDLDAANVTIDDLRRKLALAAGRNAALQAELDEPMNPGVR